MPAAPLRDTPANIASAMVAVAGRRGALAYMVPRTIHVRSWRELRTGVTVIWAVLRT